MLALHILDQNKLMTELLKAETFDGFSLLDGQVTTFCSFQIDGRWQTDFFDEEEERTFAPWSLVRPHVLALIKGRRAPKAFRFVLRFSEADTEALLAGTGHGPEEVFSLSLSLRFDGRVLALTTGTSLKSFTRERTIETLWDEYVADFLHQKGIAVTAIPL